MEKITVKKVLMIVLAAIVAVVVVGAIGLVINWYQFRGKGVSTYEELINLKYNDDNIYLTADIDCEYNTIEPISCSYFDGNGYTIKNAVISNVSVENKTAFFSGGESIKNVNFENIRVKSAMALSAAIVCNNRCNSIENVHVKNCEMEIGQGKAQGALNSYSPADSYVGVIFGGESNPIGGVSKIKCDIKNCSVDNVKIKFTGIEVNSAYGNYGTLYAGGIAGRCRDVSDCRVENCSIEVESKHTYNDVYLGGIVGYSENAISNSYSAKNTLTAVARYRSTSMGLGSAATIYVGGIAAKSANGSQMKYCYAENNNIDGNCAGEIFAGGIIGFSEKTTVSQCYAKSNEIYIHGNLTDIKNTLTQYAGGLIGSVKGCSVMACYAYNDKAIKHSCDSTEMRFAKVAGLIGEIDDSTVMNCATYNHAIDAANSDEFAVTNSGDITECYVSNTKYGNVNNCDVLDSAVWQQPNEIKTKLKLMGSYWKYENESIPYLDFKQSNE